MGQTPTPHPALTLTGWKSWGVMSTTWAVFSPKREKHTSTSGSLWGELGPLTSWRAGGSPSPL